jgi:anti-anti-sigma factor
VVLELGDLDFLDSSGIAVLVRIANHFDQVRTRSATEPVRRVIEVLGLADRFGLDGA